MTIATPIKGANFYSIMTNFGKFLSERIENPDTAVKILTNTTANGMVTIQQTQRNQLRKEGLQAFKQDLIDWYGNEGFDVVETKEGIVIVAEAAANDDGDNDGGYTFSWEIKPTIKNLDYDPFIEANNFEEDKANKAQKKARQQAEKEAKNARLIKKREERLAAIATALEE